MANDRGRAAARLTPAILLLLGGCAPAVPQYALDVVVSGDGATTPGAGTHGYPAGTSVEIEVAPASGSAFVGWDGDATGTANPLRLVMDGDKVLTATFRRVGDHTLRIGVTGSGSTSPAPGLHAYAPGTVVELTASPAGGATFSGWSGAAAGSGRTVSVTMDADLVVTAAFVAASEPAACDATPPSGPAYYASPAGTGTACTLAAPCALATAAEKPNPGETVYLRGGTYPPRGGGLWFNVSRSGDPSRGWITFAAYPCELPMIDVGGVSVSGSWVRFDGLVARNAATGFGNRWTGAGTTSSNGHLEFLNCIADMNSMAGIAFRSAVGVHVKQCLVAHNGSSTTASWSSGVDLFGAQGTYRDNVVESTVAFENVDMQHHSDGSGFIVDDIGTGATFVNNIGFRNGGSCIRLTTSKNTHLVNNTCYHDGLDPQAGSDPQYSEPKSPGEILFSGPDTWTGAVMVNNLAAASGWNGTQLAYNGTGALAVAPWNLGVDRSGPTPFLRAPDAQHPDFGIAAGATAIIGAGTTAEAPPTDIGFDPKCITRAPPAGAGAQSWWIHAIDYEYIRSIGGVARCFQPKARTGRPDLGAYAH